MEERESGYKIKPGAGTCDSPLLICMLSRERDAIEYLRRPKPRKHPLARCNSFCRRGSGAPSVTLLREGFATVLVLGTRPNLPRSSPSRVRGEQASRLPGFHMQMQPNVAKPFTTSTMRVCEIARVRSTDVRRFLSVYVYVCERTSCVEVLCDGYPTTLPVRGNFSSERTLDDGDQHLSSRNLREEIIERDRKISLATDGSLGRDP